MAITTTIKAVKTVHQIQRDGANIPSSSIVSTSASFDKYNAQTVSGAWNIEDELYESDDAVLTSSSAVGEGFLKTDDNATITGLWTFSNNLTANTFSLSNNTNVIKENINFSNSVDIGNDPSISVVYLFGGEVEVARVTSLGMSMQSRLVGQQGSDIVSTSQVTLNGTNNGNTYVITGNTEINLINIFQWKDGARVTLKFSGTPRIRHNQTASGFYSPILLAAGEDLVMEAGDTLDLALIDGEWNEVSRSHKVKNKKVTTTIDFTIVNTHNVSLAIPSSATIIGDIGFFIKQNTGSTLYPYNTVSSTFVNPMVNYNIYDSAGTMAIQINVFDAGFFDNANYNNAPIEISFQYKI